MRRLIARTPTTAALIVLALALSGTATVVGIATLIYVYRLTGIFPGCLQMHAC